MSSIRDEVEGGGGGGWFGWEGVDTVFRYVMGGWGFIKGSCFKGFMGRFLVYGIREDKGWINQFHGGGAGGEGGCLYKPFSGGRSRGGMGNPIPWTNIKEHLICYPINKKGHFLNLWSTIWIKATVSIEQQQQKKREETLG